MPKNPTTPLNSTRLKRLREEDPDPRWAPVGKENASPNTKIQRLEKNIAKTLKLIEQNSFFYSQTEKGRALNTLYKDVLHEEREALKKAENERIAIHTMPRLVFDLPGQGQGLWAEGPALLEESTTGESSAESSDNDSGFETPRSVTLIL